MNPGSLAYGTPTYGFIDIRMQGLRQYCGATIMNHQIREIKGLTARELGKPHTILNRSVQQTHGLRKTELNYARHPVLDRIPDIGRGRLGRVWHADAGRSLSMSLLFKPSYSAALLPLICGIAVSQALCMLTGRYYQIKWPNDIICRDLKICGILCENCLLPHGGYAVAGIGINLLQTGEEFKKEDCPMPVLFIWYPDGHRIWSILSLRSSINLNLYGRY